MSIPELAFYQEDKGANEMLQMCATVSNIADRTFDPINIVLSTKDSSQGIHIVQIQCIVGLCKCA